MKELTRTYSDLLQDKRVRGEQNKYEAFSRSRNAVLSKYRKVYQAYRDLQQGLTRAQQFYDEMKETTESLQKNVETFVENRRSEGGQLLGAIEAAKGSGADREQARLKELMERMSISPTSQQSQSPIPNYGDQRSAGHRPPPLQQQALSSFGGPQSGYNPAASPPITPYHQGNGIQSPGQHNQAYGQGQPTPQTSAFRSDSTHNYNPGTYGAMSPPAHQQYFSPPPSQQNAQRSQPSTTHYGQQPQAQQYGMQGVPAGWQPPPPPPGPPPSQDYGVLQATTYPSGPGGYAQETRRNTAQSQSNGASSGSGDPFAGLSGWR